jgi:hypothetical protein
MKEKIKFGMGKDYIFLPKKWFILRTLFYYEKHLKGLNMLFENFQEF